MKLRLPGRRDSAATTTASGADASTDLTEQLARDGRQGPPHAEAQRGPGPPHRTAPPPPTTRREAYRRMREQRRPPGRTARAASARGDDNDLPARDRGPERKLVRDIVDSRRNVGSCSWSSP